MIDERVAIVQGAYNGRDKSVFPTIDHLISGASGYERSNASATDVTVYQIPSGRVFYLTDLAAEDISGLKTQIKLFSGGNSIYSQLLNASDSWHITDMKGIRAVYSNHIIFRTSASVSVAVYVGGFLIPTLSAIGQ